MFIAGRKLVFTVGQLLCQGHNYATVMVQLGDGCWLHLVHM